MSSDVLRITNSRGGLLLRNDNVPCTLYSRGFLGWPSAGNITGSGRKDSRVPFSRLDITGINAPIVALRTHSDSPVYGATSYVDGRVYYHVFGSVSAQVEYFIFTPSSKPGGNSGLQLFKPNSTELAFDSSWPMMLPIGAYQVGRDSTTWHNLGIHPAFIPLNQCVYADSRHYKWAEEAGYGDNTHRVYKKKWFTEGKTLAVRVDSGSLRTGYIAGIGNSNALEEYSDNTPNWTYSGPVGPSNLRVLLVNVDNL